jgi:hypothetical protein
MDRLTEPLRTQPCPIKECGARVILTEIDGARVSLNPVWTTVAVPRPEGGFTWVRGLQPHAQTCVDIAGRNTAPTIAGGATLH